jgi:membrane-associated phosphatidylinositol transfer protein
MPNVCEFQIPMPLSLEEYHRGQLYMIAKFSREHSEENQKSKSSRQGGKKSGRADEETEGIEFLVNEPYDADPENGLPFAGQYTHKIIHFSSSVAPWLRAVLPASALQIHEKSWSAFPRFSRTTYHSTALGDRFKLRVDTLSLDADCCSTENAHGLEGAELKRRKVDVVDIVADEYPADKYKEEEDPKVFRSEETGRGPLGDDWIQVAQQALEREVDPELDALGLSSGGKKTKKTPKRGASRDSSTSNNNKQNKDQKRKAKKKGKSASKEEKEDAPHPVMTTYKLSTCEVKAFGLGGKIENWVQNSMTRDILLHGHRQAYAWIDEWHDMDIDDIREFEEETARALEQLRHGKGDSDSDSSDDEESGDEDSDGEDDS